jgi:hypothetical protein
MLGLEADEYVVTPHARYQMARRGLTETSVRAVLHAPDQRIGIRPGRIVYQSIVDVRGGMSRWLVRVFVDVDRKPAEVVTAYRTSRIGRYWRDSVR